MNIIYRKAEFQDIELLTETRLNLLKEDSGPITENEKILLYQSNKEYMKNGMLHNSFFAFLAFDLSDSFSENIFVGTCSACLYAVLPGRKLPNGKHAYIQNTYVKPDYRGKGIAKKLVSFVIAEAMSMGYKDISLHATKMGQLLFKSCGFKEDINVGLTFMEYHA